MQKLKRFEDLLLFLTILLLPTQLGRHFWPAFSYIYSLPVDFLSPTIYFWDLLVICLITTFFFQKKNFNLATVNLFLIFILTQAVSLLPIFSRQINYGAGLVRLEQYLIAGLFGVYIVSSKFNPSASLRASVQSSKLYIPLALAVIFESVLAILQFIKGGSLGLWILGERTFNISTPAIAKFDYLGNVFLRPYGTLPHPNVLAAFLLISMILVSGGRAEVSKRLYKIIMVLGTAAILLTVSRVSILLLAGFLVLKFGKKYLKQLMILFIILAPVLYARFSSVINYDNLSLVRREELISNAFNYFLSSPILGIGLSNFIPYISSELIAGPSKFLQPVHNIFLLALAETGVVGLIGWMLLIGYSLIKFKVQNSKFKVIWFSILILGLFDHYFLTLPQGYRLLFLIWGLSFKI